MEKASPVAPACRFASPDERRDGPLCHCTGVAEGEVHAAVQECGLTTVEEVGAETGAGTGCGACRCRIQRVLGGLPAKCGGRFDYCYGCGSIASICSCGSLVDPVEPEPAAMEPAATHPAATEPAERIAS